MWIQSDATACMHTCMHIHTQQPHSHMHTHSPIHTPHAYVRMSQCMWAHLVLHSCLQLCLELLELSLLLLKLVHKGLLSRLLTGVRLREQTQSGAEEASDTTCQFAATCLQSTAQIIQATAHMYCEPFAFHHYSSEDRKNTPKSMNGVIPLQ